MRWNTLKTAGLVVVKEGRLLLAFSKNKRAWYLPGGKVESGETPEAALVREIEEELHVKINASLLKYYTHISAPAYGEEDLQMEQDCYLYPLNEPVIPGNEIEAVRYFTSEEYQQQEAQVAGTIEIFRKLRRDLVNL